MSRSGWFLGLVLLAGVAQAQERPARGPDLAAGEDGRVLMTWDRFKEVTRWDEHRLPGDDAGDKDRFVIPWKDVQDLLHVEIEEVGTAELKLPWKEFKTLLEWSVREEARRKKEALEQEEPPPVPYLVGASEYTGKGLSEDGATFVGKFKVEILEKEGWKNIPLLPSQVAVSEARLPDGVHLQLAGGMYTLLTEQAGAIEAEIEFSVGVTESGGRYALSFNKIASGTCVLDLTVPEQDVVVDVPSAQSKLARQTDNGTRVVAALPAEAPVAVSWERAIPEAETVPPTFYSETRTLVSVADGLLLGQAQVTFSILHTPTRQLTLNVPPGVSVLEVAGPFMRDWRGGEGKVSVQLGKEVIGSYTLNIKYERSQDMADGEADIPVLTGSGVVREKGHIGVVALTNVEIASDRVSGAHPVDVKSLPPEIMAMTSQPILLAYRYVEPGFQVGLKIGMHEDVGVLLTVVDRAHVTVMQTFDGRRLTRAIYNVRNNRNQFLRLRLPEDADIWSASVAGRATQPAQDVEGRVLLPLVRSQGSGGMSAFPVEIVYAEPGTAPDERGEGIARVALPICSEPVLHLMVTLRVPEEGRYDDFSGTLRAVEDFSRVGGEQAAAQGAQAVMALQQAFVARQSKHVAAAGATPIEVQLPMAGETFRLEKILVLDDPQWFSYAFSRLRR